MQIEVQGDVVKVVGRIATKPKTFQRGEITSFSRKSRKRLLEMVARFEQREKTVMLTLTFGQRFPSANLAKKFLKTFLQRLRRKFPRVSGFWRLEYQKRGAPHFHLMLFDFPYVPAQDIARSWAEVIGDEYCNTANGQVRPPSVQIKLLKGKKQAMYYCSKYMAKTEDDRDGGTFNDVPYLHTGRYWAAFGKRYLPYAPLKRMHFYCTRTLHMLEFWAKREYPKLRKELSLQGFTLFTKNAQEWGLILMSIIEETGIVPTEAF